MLSGGESFIIIENHLLSDGAALPGKAGPLKAGKGWQLVKKYYLPILLGLLLSLILPVLAMGDFSAFSPMETLPAAALSPEDQEGQVTIHAVGDVMLARKVGQYMNGSGLDYPIARTKDFLMEADITFANLESPLADTGVPLPGKGIWFRAVPAGVETLLMGGFDIVSLANNHAMDYDAPALLQSIEILQANNIVPIGAGADEKAARKAHIEEINGLTLGWLAYSEMADLFFSHNYPRRMQAEEGIPGIAPFAESKIVEDIEALKEQADIVILSLHWGLEYQDIPEEYQRMAARRLIDAGADIILGHHPHCIQGAETYKQGLIVYSLGNFIFDQDWSQKTSEGLILRLELSPLGWKSARFYPVFIEECRPRLLTGSPGQMLLQRFQEISQGFETVFIPEQDCLAIAAP